MPGFFKAEFILNIDTFGRVIHPKITLTIIPDIENETMRHVNGIIVHQVHQADSSTAQSTLDQYRSDPKRGGTHFLIDKDGTIYQTASVYKKAFHVPDAMRRAKSSLQMVTGEYGESTSRGEASSSCQTAGSCSFSAPRASRKLLIHGGRFCRHMNTIRAIERIERLEGTST